jgi:hypothetical protein
MFMGVRHAPFFIFGQKIIDQHHDQPQQEGQNPRPQTGKSCWRRNTAPSWEIL